MKILAMIPARMGSQRLKRKNALDLDGIPLIAHAIRKCKQVNVFDEIWVNSEHLDFKAIAEGEGVNFHERPAELANNVATSEQFVAEFLEKHACDMVVQVHSIAPLLTAREVGAFVKHFAASDKDVMLSCIHDQIEVAYQDEPVNFTFAEKTNSQELKPTQRITWSITGWRREPYLAAFRAGKCATYSGSIGFYPVSGISGHVIKTQRDFDIAEALLPILQAAEAAGETL